MKVSSTSPMMSKAGLSSEGASEVSTIVEIIAR
jgi:hypothetical protein